ncbi:MAG: hypothetical protein ABSC57_03485 [Syntrophales bacterium]
MNGINDLIDYFAVHQFTAGICIFVAILIIYFLFKKLIKIAVLFIVVVIILAAYANLKESGRMPRNIQEAIYKAKEETQIVVERARGVYDGVIALFEKPRNRATDYSDKIGEDKETHKKRMP